MAREVFKVLEAGLAEIALELGILLEAGRGKVEEPVPLPFGQFPPVPAGGGGTSLLAAGSGLAQFGGVAAQLGGGMIAGGVAQGSTAAQHGVGLTGAGAQTSSNSGGNGFVLAGISPFGDNVHLPGGVGGDQHLTAVGETVGQRIKHDSKAALVKVTRGQMTVQNVVSGLERLIPGNWKWVVEENGDNTFRTIFTSTAELKRMVEWGTIHTKVGDAEMKIIERGVGNEVKYVLPKGSSVSDEEFDGLVEESAGAESVKSHESLAVKLAAVPDAILSPARQSKRRASDSDQLTLQRAEKIKAGRNLEV
ncbi:hypothetical protein OsI_29188 [Oryza sativa Indica Group]|uniref:Uncharacterized protein n=1 Tax=Oryza sativa subsp. indica TaxID=39946 RepID=B8BAK8_ORYSI|nr:hypothetical protein OsI_29188 [Oryza sativa Indica Group]